MWCKVCSEYDYCKNANDRCVMCSRNILYKDYFESKDNLINEIHNNFKRKVKLKDGEIESFWYKGERNPCECGSNLFHEEYDGKHLYGVCNACDLDIYELKFDEDYIKNSEWKIK